MKKQQHKIKIRYEIISHESFEKLKRDQDGLMVFSQGKVSGLAQRFMLSPCDAIEIRFLRPKDAEELLNYPE